MNIDKDIAKKVQDLQMLDQNLQGFIAQKQVNQLELNESNNALDELKKTSSSEVFKITGGIMIKTKKEDLVKNLEEKKKLLDLRVNSIEKQEKLLEEKASKLREDINKELIKKG